MSDKPGWLLRDVPCPSCNQLHDLFVEDEPVAPYAIDYTCEVNDTSARFRGFAEPEAVKSQPSGSVFATVENRD